jgi:hypothetical protein
MRYERVEGLVLDGIAGLCGYVYMVVSDCSFLKAMVVTVLLVTVFHLVRYAITGRSK